MSRKLLIDRLFGDEPWHPLFRPHADAEIRARAEFEPALRRAVCFEISNVADYCLEHDTFRGSTIDGRTIRTKGEPYDADRYVCAPMYPTMWFEYRAPALASSEDGPGGDVHIYRESDGRRSAVIGWLVRAIDLDKESELRDEYRDHHAEHGHDLAEDVRWLLMCTEWTRYDRTPKSSRPMILGPNFDALLDVNAQGIIRQRTLAASRVKDDPVQMKSSDWTDAYSKWLPIQFAMTFMNCRNVRHETVGPDRRMSRAHVRKKRGRRPLVDYRVLRLDLTREQVVRHGDDEPATLGGDREASRLHICRGHFRVYSEDRPLFGRYVGPVWVPAHVRGSRDAGTLVKDYDLRMGEETRRNPEKRRR